MKPLLLFFFTFGFSQLLFAQVTVKINVPEVKEAPQIDEALKKAVANALPGKSIFLLETESRGQECRMHVSAIKVKNSYYDLYDKEYIGVKFFHYRGYLVFVKEFKDQPCHFFTETKRVMPFVFLNNYNKYKTNSVWNFKDYKMSFRSLDFLKYENGHFVSDLMSN